MKIICTQEEKEMLINDLVVRDCYQCILREICDNFENADSCEEVFETAIDWEVEING